MSPRKTRRGAKDGNNDTLSETTSKKSLMDTPAENQPKMRTRRQLTKVNSLESEGDQSPDPSIIKSTRKKVSDTPSNNKSTRKVVSETPTKSTRSRKNLLLETTILDESVLSIVKPRRTRKIKEYETLVDQSVLLDSTALDNSTVRANKSRGEKARKKAEPKVPSEEQEKPAKRINASAAKNVTILENCIDLTVSDNSDPMSSEDTEVLQVSTRISRVKAAAAAASPLIGNRRSRHVKQRLEDFTPESSPITVNLTPHRTTKTPRKSPMNLSSPKSHADAPLRLSKTPRKLPVVVDSPVPSEMSVTSSSNTTPDKPNNLEPKKPKKSRESRKSPGKSPRKSPAIVVSIRKFSKSPKIVLRSPKQKSSKSKTPVRSASKSKRSSQPKTKSPAKSIKSPNKTPEPARRASKSPKSPKRSINNVAKSVVSPGDLMSLHLARIDSPKAGKSKLDMITKKGTPDAQPVVTKRSPVANENSEIVTRTSLRRAPVDSPKTTPAMSPSVQKRNSQGGESPHRARISGQKRTAFTDSGTPLRPIDSPWTTVNNKAAAGKSIILSSSETPVDSARTKAARYSGGRMAASTPRERTRRSLNLSPGLENPSIINTSPVNGEVTDGRSVIISGGRGKRRSARIDDESNPLISEDESFSPRAGISHLNGTYELDKDATVVVGNERETSANGTYELAEPKTPSLRRKAGKRSIEELENSIEDRSVKRTCRVRFASPALDRAQKQTIGGALISRSRSATPRHRVGIKHTHNDSKIAELQDSRNDIKGNIARRRSNSMINVSIAKTPVADKRRSNSASDAIARSAIKKAQTASVNRLSKPRLSIPSAKKSEVKTPVAKKTPNFAGIHQKQFAKMESLVDAKKRVENRHVAMTSQIPTIFTRVKSKLPTKPAVSTQPIGPIVAVNNGAYNRYGFKLRKDEAIKMVTQKKPTHISQKKQTENRMVLKGVRTNRRFDLIMKARNINK